MLDTTNVGGNGGPVQPQQRTPVHPEQVDPSESDVDDETRTDASPSLVEAVFLRRFIAETIRHLSPLVASTRAVPPKDHGPPAATSVGPASHEGGAAGEPLVVVTTPGNPREGDCAASDVVWGPPVSQVNGNLSNVVDAFCRSLASAVDEACARVDNKSAASLSRSVEVAPQLSPIECFFAVALPRAADALHGQFDHSSGSDSSLPPTPNPGHERPLFFGGPMLQAYATSSSEFVNNSQFFGPSGSDDGGTVSSWLQETFSTTTRAKRLGNGKNDNQGKRSVTKMSSLGTKASAQDAGASPSGTGTATIHVPHGTTGEPKRFSGIGTLHSPAESGDGTVGGTRKRNLSVGFKLEDGPPRTDGGQAIDDTNGAMLDSTTTEPRDPFANVAPLSTPSEDPATQLPTVPSRRGSQYFRRQSATLTMPASLGDTTSSCGSGTYSVSSGQSLNPTETIKMRLAALNVPWLDVDNTNFDIFDVCKRLDAKEIVLPTPREKHRNNTAGASSKNEGERDKTTKSTVDGCREGIAAADCRPVGETKPTLSSTHVFVYVCMNVMLRYSFVDQLKLDLKKLHAFLLAVENLYLSDNPYHNSIHAADVLQTSHIYLLTNDVYENFFEREILCLLLAALVHDVGHLGVNNQFLVKTHHPLAVLYNGLSPLENMHSLLAFRLLEQDELNFLQGSDVWSAEDYQDLEAKVVEMVIATDMKFHGASVAMAKDLLKEGFSVDDGDIDKLIKMIIHAADLSNPMKPRAVYQNWLERVVAEFFRQGEAEAARGLPISPNFDRATMKVPEMQVGFINFVVKPYATALSAILPAEWIERMQENLSFMQSLTGRPYSRKEVVLGMCSEPWVDHWHKVEAFVLSTSPSVSPSSPVKGLVSSPVESSPVCNVTPSASKSIAPETTHVPSIAATPVPSISRPGSSIAMSPAAALLAEAQTRFCMGAYETTHTWIRKTTEAHAEGRLSTRLAVSEQQRTFAVAMVRHLLKTLEILTAARECFGGRAAILIDCVREQIHSLLAVSTVAATHPVGTSSPTGIVAQDQVAKQLATDPQGCFKLFKTKWLAMTQHERPFNRYTPRGKEQDVYRETLRQCVQTFSSVLQGLAAARPTDADSTPHVQQHVGPLGMPSPLPLPDAGRGRGLYSSGGLGLGTVVGGRAVATPPPMSSAVRYAGAPHHDDDDAYDDDDDSASFRPHQGTGRSSAPLVGPRSNATPAVNSMGGSPQRVTPNRSTRTVPTTAVPATEGRQSTTTTDSNYRRKLPPLPFVVTPEPRGAEASTSSHSSASPHSKPASNGSNRVPLVTLEVCTGNASPQPLELVRVVGDDDDEEPLSTAGNSPMSGAHHSGGGGMVGLERTAQLHFQQSDDHWRMAQNEEGSPRSFGLPSVGSFRNAKQLRPQEKSPVTRNPPADASSDDGHDHETQQQQQQHPGTTDLTLDLLASITAAIPNAYFLPPGSPHFVGGRPRSPPSNGSPLSGTLNGSYTGPPLNGSMDALSFIPMVHSVDPSPRRLGNHNSPQSGMPLEYAPPSLPPSSAPLNDVDAHNLLQLEMLLLHHATHGAAVQNIHSLHPPHAADNHPRHSSDLPRAGSSHRRTIADSEGSPVPAASHVSLRHASTRSDPSSVHQRSMSPENAMRLVEDRDLDVTNGPRTTSLQSITDHLQRAAASFTEMASAAARSPTAQHPQRLGSPPPPLPPQSGGNSTSHGGSQSSPSPKRRSSRGLRAAASDAPPTESSPINNPLYRQQLADMLVHGLESHTFTSSSQNGSPAPLTSHDGTPPPTLTPMQMQSIEEGCLVPEVYRATSFRSMESFRSAQGRRE